MARAKGMLNLSGNLEVNAQAPLDARTIVPTEADLTVANNFPYPYVGLEVYVTGTGKKFRLINLDTTQSSSWQEIGEGGGGTLPIATANTLGGVKIGAGISVTQDGVISVQGGGGGSVTPSLSVIDVNSVFTNTNVTVQSIDEYYSETKNFSTNRYITFDLPWVGDYKITYVNPSSHQQEQKILTADTLGGIEYMLDLSIFLDLTKFNFLNASNKTTYTYTADHHEDILAFCMGLSNNNNSSLVTSKLTTTGTENLTLTHSYGTGGSTRVLTDNYEHNIVISSLTLENGETASFYSGGSSYCKTCDFIIPLVNQIPSTASIVFVKGMASKSGEAVYGEYEYTVDTAGNYFAFALNVPVNVSKTPLLDCDILLNGTTVLGVQDKSHMVFADTKNRIAIAELKNLSVNDVIKMKIGVGYEQGAMMMLMKA